MKNDKVSKAKRLIARMDKSEIREIGRYMNERYRLLEKRETWRRQTEQYRAYWEKISALSPGSKVAVNAYGDRQWPRGTELQIDLISDNYFLRLATIRIFGFSPPAFTGTLLPGREEKSGNRSTGKEAYVADERGVQVIGSIVKGRDERAYGSQVPGGRGASQPA